MPILTKNIDDFYLIMQKYYYQDKWQISIRTDKTDIRETQASLYCPVNPNTTQLKNILKKFEITINPDTNFCIQSGIKGIAIFQELTTCITKEEPKK